MNTTQLQAAFDIDALLVDLERELAPTWTGAPLHYHEDHYSPRELDAAFERWIFENGRYGCIPDSHMWHRYMFGPEKTPPVSAHEFALYSAETSCRLTDHDHHGVTLPRGARYQTICEPCGWRKLGNSDSAVIEAWHDHALPGWRELPIVPIQLQGIPPRGRDPLGEWVAENYPLDWQKDGYPIITERTSVGTRHVPGRSPWGGYDLSSTALH